MDDKLRRKLDRERRTSEILKESKLKDQHNNHSVVIKTQTKEG